jgi:2-succinyl-5-enolpyruvyl-6-hydroxy-3-cyclohexene-1-carboxylate synthase
LSISCVLQILALLQDRQSTQSQNNTTTQLTDDERTAELQALSNLKKAVEKHSGIFLGSRQQVRLMSMSNTYRSRFWLNRYINTLKGIMSIHFPSYP